MNVAMKAVRPRKRVEDRRPKAIGGLGFRDVQLRTMAEPIVEAMMLVGYGTRF